MAKSTLIRTGKVKPGLVTDGQSIQPIARVKPHNANKTVVIPNRFVKKVDA